MSESGYYRESARHYVAVDCVILGLHEEKLNILLIKRRMEPCRGEWSLMGGFVEERESLDDAAKRVLKQLTGLEDVYMRQIGTFGAVDRDPGARVISTAYCALVNFAEQNLRLVADNDAHWLPMDQMPPLAFDHGEMVEKALDHLKKRVFTEPLLFEVVGKEFTMTQLQNAYSTISGAEVDKRNFRRWVSENFRLEETGEVDKRHSRRGARIYRRMV